MNGKSYKPEGTVWISKEKLYAKLSKDFITNSIAGHFPLYKDPNISKVDKELALNAVKAQIIKKVKMPHP